MNQLYAEASVKRKDNVASLGMRILVILAMVLGFFFLFFTGNAVFSIVGAVLIFGAFYMYPKLNVVYEYVFVDGQIDFDRILGGNSRKTAFRIDMDQVEIIAPVGAHELDGYTYIKTEVKNFSSNDKSNKVYVLIGTDKEKKLKILFEPNEKMLSMMKQKSPRKVII